MTRMASTGMMATADVLMDRASVWFIDRLISCGYVMRPLLPMPLVLSRTRSNTTTVS